jgi:hypothetical protein
MDKIKIIVERNSTRCEICHQSDLFVPAENICKRCDTIQLSRQDTNLTGKDRFNNGYGRTVIESSFSKLNTGSTLLFAMILLITVVNYLLKYLPDISSLYLMAAMAMIFLLLFVIVKGINQIKNPARLLTCTDRGIIYYQPEIVTFIPWKRIKDILLEEDETETLVLHINYDERQPIPGVGRHSNTFYINIDSTKGFKPNGKELYQMIRNLFISYQ